MSKSATKTELSSEQRKIFLDVLKLRFEKHKVRHQDLTWHEIQVRLENTPTKIWSLHEMEKTGGEPDVVGRHPTSGTILFFDCSPETPKERRSVCYDNDALESRKEHKPASSAVGMAAAMGIELLSEDQYFALQKLGDFDLKTSSWLKTPPQIRNLGGALFGDRRFGRTFIYHNGAQSYYSSRAFRGVLEV